jgi:hypothetical protein
MATVDYSVAHRERCRRYNKCHPDRRKEQTKRYRDKNKGRIAEANRNYRERKMQWIRKLKLKCGCSQCGYNKYHGALHFHHLDKNTKLFQLTAYEAPRHSMSKIMAEIAKCVVLCANCHAEVHGGV